MGSKSVSITPLWSLQQLRFPGFCPESCPHFRDGQWWESGSGNKPCVMGFITVVCLAPAAALLTADGKVEHSVRSWFVFREWSFKNCLKSSFCPFFYGVLAFISQLFPAEMQCGSSLWTSIHFFLHAYLLTQEVASTGQDWWPAANSCLSSLSFHFLFSPRSHSLLCLLLPPPPLFSRKCCTAQCNQERDL